MHHVAVRAVVQHPAVVDRATGAAPAHAGVAVVDVLGETADQRLGAGIGLVIDGGAVLRVAALVQHAELLRRRQLAEGRAGLGHGHLAPDDLVVAVVLALDEGQHEALGGSGRLGVVVDQPAEAVIAALGQHLVLLRCREVGKGGALGRHAALIPVDVGVLVVHAFDQLRRHAQPGLGAGVDEHLVVIDRVAQRAGHHVALRRRQLLEAGAGGRGGHAAPVDGVDGVLRAGREAFDYLHAFGRIQVDPVLAAVDLIAQRMGHHRLLRRREAGEAGAGRGLARRAPVDVGVAVVHRRTLGEAGDGLLARGRVVVEEALLQPFGLHQRIDGAALRRAQLGVAGIGARLVHAGSLPVHQAGVVGREALAFQVGRLGRGAGRLQAQRRVDHGLLCRAELGVGGVVARLGRVLRPRHQEVAVVDLVAQRGGHHRLLRAAELRKGGAGRRGGHAPGCPVDALVGVGRRHALHEAGEHLRARRRVGLEEDRAGVELIARGVGHALGQRRDEALALGRIGVVEAAVRMDGVAQRQGHLVLGRLRQRLEGLVVGQRRHGRAVRQRQALRGQQRAQRVGNGAPVQRRGEGSEAVLVQRLSQRPPGDRVEVVGRHVGAEPGVQVERAVGQQRAGELERAGGVDVDARALGALLGDGAAAFVAEPGAGHDGRAGFQVEPLARRQLDAGAGLAGVLADPHHRALQHAQAGAGLQPQQRARALREQRAGGVDGAAGGNAHGAARTRGVDVGRAVHAQAVDLGTEVQQAVDAGGVQHVELHRALADEPARNHGLLVHLQYEVACTQARIGRAHGVLHVLAAHLQQARLQRQRVAGLHVAEHGHVVCA